MLAVATYSAVRSSNRSARIAEQTLLTGMRPLLVPSLADDPVQKVVWMDRHAVHLGGGRATLEEAGGAIYLAMGLRNLGAGIALLHGWYPMPDRVFADARVSTPRTSAASRSISTSHREAPGTGKRRSGTRTTPVRPGFLSAMSERREFTIDLLYGDQQGGQRTISRFTVLPAGDNGWYCQAGRHWNVDQPDPR